MEQILLLSKENDTAIMMLYINMKVMVCSPNGNTDDFDIVIEVLQRDILALYIFIICLDYILTMNINRSNKRKWFHIEKR